jgi:hypothetical protein
MPTKLPAPIAAYFTANNVHDIDAMLAPFAETAVVKDEGREWRGSAAIRQWMQETTAKYAATVAVTDVVETDGKTLVTGRVSGNFPGSPVDLQFAVTLAGAKISRLEIS